LGIHDLARRLQHLTDQVDDLADELRSSRTPVTTADKRG
jgi:hypothetical protein